MDLQEIHASLQKIHVDLRKIHPDLPKIHVGLREIHSHQRSIGEICRKFMGTFTNSGCPQNFNWHDQNSNVLSRAIAGFSGLICRKRLQKVHADLQKVHANLQEIHTDLQKIHADLQINNHGNAD